MSALCQKRTYAVQQISWRLDFGARIVSALPPKADMMKAVISLYVTTVNQAFLLARCHHARAGLLLPPVDRYSL
jgi:hypothetical protein